MEAVWIVVWVASVIVLVTAAAWLAYQVGYGHCAKDANEHKEDES